MSEPYDLRSNIKGKPGSQGTLFQVRDKGLLNPAQRWPRGYTPERQAEVNANLHGADSPFLLSDRAGTGPARREMNETLKRSTVPAEDLAGVKFHPGQASLDTYNGGRHAGEILGVYRNERQGVKPEVSVLKGQEGTDTVIHEIGHHVSAQRATEHSRYETGYQRGQEEGFADSYAFEHYRDRRGKPMTDMRGYPTPQHPDDTHRMNFSSAYHAARSHIPFAEGGVSSIQRTPQQERFVAAKEAESKGETLFTTWDSGDGTVGFHARSDRPHSLGEEIGRTRKGRT